MNCARCNQETDRNEGRRIDVSIYDIHEGGTYSPKACADCSGRNGLRWCPDCKAAYIAPNREWYTNTPPRSAVPCPEHSLDPHSPVSSCTSCGGRLGGSVRVDRQGRPMCDRCSDDLKICGMDYCSNSVHPRVDTEWTREVPRRRRPGNFTINGVGEIVQRAEQPDTYTVHYCSEECREIGPDLAGYFHRDPRLWDYDPDCLCQLCRWLRGRDSDLWPQPTEAPVIEGTCSRCNHDAGPLTAFEDEAYCHACADMVLTDCGGCGTIHLNIPGSYPNPRLRGYCRECIIAEGYWFCEMRCRAWFPDGADCRCGGVHRYDYTLLQQHLNFMTATKQKAARSKIPFLGLEIEVEAQKEPATRASGARFVREAVGEWAYPVHDGSLRGERTDGTGGDYGFEIVTHPLSFEWINENWLDIKNLLNGLTDMGFRSWEGGRCGMHIHISRAPMSEAHQLRFIRFYYGHPMLAMCIGQRNSRDNYLSRFAPFDREPHGELIQKIRDFRNPGVRGHYAAINGTKRHTLECRWFRGTLNPISFRKNIEFIHAGWAFTSEYGNTSANEINFLKWLQRPEQRPQYSTLLSFIEDNYITKGRDN